MWQLGSLTVVAAGLAGVAAALAVPGPSGQRWWQDGRGSSAAGSGSVRWQQLLVGREDAIPLGRRLAVPVLGSGALALALIHARVLPGVAGWMLAAAAAAIMIAVLGRLEPARVRRRRQQLIMDAPQALELLASCLAAGLPLRTAVASVTDAFDGPVAEDLGRVLRLVELGMPEIDAWRTLRGHPQLGTAAVDLARSVESGTRLIETLNHHARLARADRRAALQVRARAVGVQSVLPLMACFLPAFLLLGVVPSVVSAVLKALP